MKSFSKNLRKMIFPLVIVVSCFVLQSTSVYNYLLFHTLVELFAVIISFGIFAVAWSSRGFVNNNYLLILGIGYFFVGSADLLHALSRDGMSIFPGYTINLSTQLWVIARYVEAFSFVGAILFFHNNFNQVRQNRFNANGIFLFYATIFFGILLLVFYWGIFPMTYVDGVGLTTFKKVSEYVISSMFLFAIMLLYKKKDLFDSKIYNLLSLALLIKIISELFFIEHVSVDNLFNMFGHLFKFISFLLIYKAILEIGLMNPYRFLFYDLKKSQEEYRVAQNELQQRIKKDLVAAYEHIGIANRKMSLLLEIERHSKQKKNKNEIVAYIANVIKNACNACITLIYTYEKDGVYKMVFGEGSHKSVMNNLSRVRTQDVNFLQKITEEKRRMNAPCGIFDIGNLNVDGKLSYFVAVPFIVEDKCKGFLFLGFDKRKSIASQELDFIDVFAMHISSALTKLEVIRRDR